MEYLFYLLICIFLFVLFAVPIWRSRRRNATQRKRDDDAFKMASEIYDALKSGSEIPSNKNLHLFLRPFESTRRLTFAISSVYQYNYSVPKEWDFELILLEKANTENAELLCLGAPVEMTGAARAGRWDDWKSVIACLARHASTIYFIPSPTDGIRWEMKMLKQERLLEKTYFILFNRYRFKEGLEALHQAGLHVPDYTANAAQKRLFGPIRIAVTRFANDGTVTESYSKKAKDFHRLSWRRIFTEG